MLSKKPVFALMLTMSTASFYFAQSTQDTIDKNTDIEQVVLTGVADIAKDRKTPVAVSTIKEAQIVQRLGNQEFPEILNSTPSVYTTKGGGGFGDGRINIRGFDTNNTAVMINGVPVNGMEDGAVYWSNWLGLSDVTSAMQVQRGLGSSKLAIASVGGTINVLTRAADKKREGNVTVGLGNDGYLKTLFSYNTGKSQTGWSSSFLMSRTAGSTYIDGSEFEAYNYYFALGYQKGKHDFQFTFTGAPQWHNQNFNGTIATYLKYGNGVDEPNRRYNSNWGYLNGQEYSQSVNYYSKPVASFNWDWTMSEKSKLSTVIYGSWGRGGGTGVIGTITGNKTSGSGAATNSKGINDAYFKDENGLIRFDDLVAWNQGNRTFSWTANGSNYTAVNATPGTATRTNGLVRRASVNSHDWYGILSNFQHKINDSWNFSAGVDGRYYYGFHPGILTDLWGNNQFIEKDNKNNPSMIVNTAYSPTAPANPFAAAVKDKSQIVYRNYDGRVLWGGVFGQLEYSKDQISAFVQGSASEQGFSRIDNWIVDGVTEQLGEKVPRRTEMKFLFGYNAKAGVNYNINDQHNVFVNAGYYSKQPNFNAVFPYSVSDGRQTGSQQIINKDLKNEKIASAEFGYGFRSSTLRANVNLYYTSWDDRFVRLTGLTVYGVERATVSLNGVKQVHMGAELEMFYKPVSYLEFNGMFSIGNWKYKNNPSGLLVDENGAPLVGANGRNDVTLALDGLKVADAAQTTTAIGATIKPVKNLDIYGTWRYYDNLYGTFSINSGFIIPESGVIPAARSEKGSLKAPSYNLTDVGASYTFDLKNGHRLMLSANVYNLFDTTYISDLRSSTKKTLSDYKDITGGLTAQQQLDAYNSNSSNFYKGLDVSNNVYFGFGRTWAATISYRF